MKYYKKSGFKSEETKVVIESLNNLLANYQMHCQKMRNNHWKAEGEALYELHETFELENNAVKLQIDEISERIRVFGKKPVSTFKEYLETKETDTSLNSGEPAKQIVNDFETLIFMH